MSKPAAHLSEGEGADHPRLPACGDGDDIVSYINRFERIAELSKVNRASYSVRLGSLLSGNAAKMYTSLFNETVTDLELLKKALLKSFCKNPYEFRMDFRSCKIQPDETYAQFGINVNRFFEECLDASTVTLPYKDLSYFMVIDILLSSLNPNLRTFIKERHNSYPRTSHLAFGN